MSETATADGQVERVIHMLTDDELEAVKAEAREDGAGLALAIVIRTLNARAKEHQGQVASDLLDLTVAIGKQGGGIIKMIAERKAPL